jgi:hypothetical protein
MMVGHTKLALDRAERQTPQGEIGVLFYYIDPTTSPQEVAKDTSIKSLYSLPPKDHIAPLTLQAQKSHIPHRDAGRIFLHQTLSYRTFPDLHRGKMSK